MDEPTDISELNERITNCPWRKKTHEVPICAGYVTPCMRVISKGNCDVVIEYFKERNENAKKQSKNPDE